MPNGSDDKWGKYEVKEGATSKATPAPGGDKWSQYEVGAAPTESAAATDSAPSKPAAPMFPHSLKELWSNIRHPDPEAMQAYAGMGEEREIKQGAPVAAKTMLEMGAGGVGAGAIKGTGALAMMGRSLATGAGVAGGSMAGDVASGEAPDVSSAMMKGAGATLTGLLIEPLVAAGSALLRPFLQKAAVPEVAATGAELASRVSSRSSQLSDLAKAEEGLRKSIVGAPSAIRRTTISPLYPEIQTPVDLYAPAKKAISSTAAQVAHGTPSELVRTKNIGRQIGQIEGTLKELIAADQQFASVGLKMEGTGIADTLEALKAKRSITFQQAQDLRSALGRAISKGQGYKLPAEVFHTLRDVHSLVDDSMRTAAESEGKLTQWENAEKVYKRFMDDFYNKNAPLKAVLDVREGMTGSTLRKLTSPLNGVRAEKALQRWGLNDQANALRKVLDMPGSKDAIREMEQAMTSPRAFQIAKLTEAREADAARVAASQKTVEASNKALSQARSKRLKILGGVGGALYGAHKLLKGEELP